MNYILYQIWFSLTLLSAIAAGLIGMIILQQNIDTENIKKLRDFRRAIAFAFFSVDAEILSRFISLTFHTTYYPITELVICCIGRFIECIGLWGLVLYITNIWPFNKKD